MDTIIELYIVNGGITLGNEYDCEGNILVKRKVEPFWKDPKYLLIGKYESSLFNYMPKKNANSALK